MKKNLLNQDFIKSYCRFCLGSCGIKIFKKKGVVKILSDKENPHSRGYFCKKGARLYDYYNKENRIFDYSIRNKIIDEKSFFISLSTDLKSITEKFGPDSIGIYFGTHAILDAAGMWNGMGFLLRIGSNSMFTVSSIDNIDKTFVTHHLTRGRNAGLVNIADIENSKTVLIVVSNPIISNGHLYSNINFKKKIIELNKKKGGFTICLDPRKTSTANYCSEHLQITPNTDWLVLLYILKLYIKFVGERKFLKNLRFKQNKNVDIFFLILKKLSIELVEKSTNLTKLQIKKVAKEYIKSNSFCFISGTGVSFSETSIISEWLLWILSSSKNYQGISKNFIRRANEVSKETIKITPNFSSRFTPDKKFAKSNELPCSAIKSLVNKKKT
jgi:anaerobic selenocysteine-containing dehydrogenase